MDYNKVINPILSRFSPKVFSGESVKESELRTLFKAAHLAPSSFNEQPWRFIYAKKENPDQFKRLLSCLSERNRLWAKDAPVLLLTIAKTDFSKNEEENRHAFHDVGIAMGFLLNQATTMGIYLRQMAGFNIEKTKKMLKLPYGFEPVAMAGLGYLPPGAQRPERIRKELKRVLMEGEWTDD